MGKKRLETVIGSRSYKDYYMNGKIDPWTEEIKLLSEIAKDEPRCALFYRWI